MEKLKPISVAKGNAVVINDRFVVNAYAFWVDFFWSNSKWNPSPVGLNDSQYSLAIERIYDALYTAQYVWPTDDIPAKLTASRRMLWAMMHDINQYGDTSRISDLYWRWICQKFNDMIALSGSGSVGDNAVFTKDLHYFRNKLNRAPTTLDEMVALQLTLPLRERWILSAIDSSAFHMYDSDFSPNGLYNLKFISYDGLFEAVYNQNGQLCTEFNDPVNMGTYNYAGYKTDVLGHIWYDVYPYANEYIGEIYAWGLGFGNVPNQTLPTNRPSESDFNKDSGAVLYRNNFKSRWQGDVD